jgi:MFS family permease
MRRSPWWVVAGSTIGLTFGQGPVMFFTFGVFVAPLTAEYGWSRATISAALFISFAIASFASPLVGKLVDRFGVRQVTLPSIALFALSGAAITLTPASPAGFLALWGIWGLFSGGQAPLPYAKVISAWFDEKRGLALGVAMCGTGIGTAILPQFARALIDAYGWRAGYIGLAAATMAFAFPAVALLVREPDRSRRGESSGPTLELPGITGAQAWRSARFLAIGAAAFLAVTTINGTIAHLVPLLTDHNTPPGIVAASLTAVGLSTIAGRLLTGYLLDRFFAPYVAAGMFLVPVLSLLLLGTGVSGMAPIAAAIGLGVGLGAEVDLIAFLVSRYFGLRSFGEIYGYLFGLFTFGTGLGPYLMGLSFDITRSYNVMLTLFAVFLIAASALISRLGPYAYPAHRKAGTELGTRGLGD